MVPSLLRGFLVCLSLLALSVAPSAAVELISVGRGGGVPANPSHQPSMSADGRYVAFATNARLTPDDKNTLSDIYVRDRVMKTTRRVSDDRGGDQPSISANGRFVAYRSLDGLTRIRVVDLEHADRRVCAAIPSESSNYDRPSDSAFISPDGHFVGYAFRPTPELIAPNGPQHGHQVMVTDLVNKQGPRVWPSGGSDTSIPDLGRVVVSFDGELVVFDSTAPIVNDANTGRDIYLSHRSTAGSIARISKVTGNVPDLGTSHSPVIAADGSRIFFLSDQPLADGDPTDRASIYLCTNLGGTFGAPVRVATKAIPLDLSPQATISGRTLAFLAKPASGPPQARVIDVTTGAETVVSTGGLVPDAAPLLSGDGATIAFSAKADGVEQVFTAAVPGVAKRAPTTVTIGASSAIANGETVVVEGAAYGLSATSSKGANESIPLIELERDGVEIALGSGPNLNAPQSAGQVLRGVFTCRARAFNDAWIEGVSAPLRVVVKPGSGILAVTGMENLTRTLDGFYPDGRVNFRGSLRLDNSRGFASAPLRIILTDAPTPAIMAFGAAQFSDVPPSDEHVLAVMDVASVAAGASTLVPIDSFTSPTETLGDFVGRGRTVLAYLREQSGNDFVSPESPPHPALILQTVPRLNENTNLPNGGTPITGDPGTDATFNPTSPPTLAISGNARIGGPSRATFAANATFNGSTRPCAPTWSLGNAAGIATISETGLVTVLPLTSPRTITVRAAFRGVNASMPVTLFPVLPKVSIRATIPTANEAGTPGEFRISRTGSTAADLTVGYRLEGTAITGVDYTDPSSGSVVIPKGQSSATLSIAPIQDTLVEGLETVVLRLLPSPTYRILGSPTATVTIEDDEPVPADQPDLMLQVGARPVAGAYTYQNFLFDETPVTQTLALKGTLNRTVTIQAIVANRGTAANSFVFQGSASGLGFRVQYFSGTTEITDAVVAGTFALPSLDPGAATTIKVAITPTADAPIGGAFECQLRASAAFPVTPSTSADLFEITVTRVH